MGRRVVIDANLALALIIRLPYSAAAQRMMDTWRAGQAELMAPTLWEYECVTGLRRAVSLNLLTRQEAAEMVDLLLALEVRHRDPSPALHQRALEWTEYIGQSKAYDAQYLALAESLEAEFWTADRRLANTLKERGHTWVHWVGE